MAAEQLLHRCLEAGDEAYSNADYDLAMAHVRVGQLHALRGSAETALLSLVQAQQLFEKRVERGDEISEHALTSVVIEIGDCRKALGHFDEAATMYEEAIRRANKLANKREVAVAKAQLGSVRLLQMRVDEALLAFQEARTKFESAEEWNQVAISWHQIGRVHLTANRFDDAEHAFRQALGIFVRIGSLVGEATTLSELGTLYNMWNRLGDAVSFYRQSAEVSVKLHDPNREGMARHNLADCLRKLGQYDEARRELLRVIEYRSPFGHAAQLWKSWKILSDVERALGNDVSATEARQKAIESYRAYRLAGGVNQSSGPLINLVSQAIKDGDHEGTAQLLDKSLEQPLDQRKRSLIIASRAILRGNRSTNAIYNDPSLSPEDIAELQLLLEQNPLPNT